MTKHLKTQKTVKNLNAHAVDTPPYTIKRIDAGLTDVLIYLAFTTPLALWLTITIIKQEKNK